MKTIILVWAVAIICIVIMCKIAPKFKWLYGAWAIIWAVLFTIFRLSQDL